MTPSPTLQAGDENGWRDIASAPRDGAGVLVFDSYQANGERYDDGRLCQTGPDGFGQVVARFDKAHGWHVAASVTNGIYIKLTNPTHWQPLPKPPNTTGDRDE